MELELTPEQRAQVELIALYAGKSPAEVLLQAAESLIDRQAGVAPTPQEFGAPPIFTREQVEQRFAQMLRNHRRR
ncbi:MAG TPA: hypothetical protein VG714_04110 [Acidobacteriaceae bacterium]|nr:hypothetical protein [Acidobacteriaceae bacterium]